MSKRRRLTYAELAALDPAPSDGWMSKADAAAYAGVSERTLERAVARGELPRDGLPGKRLFQRATLDAWLAGRAVAAVGVASLVVAGCACDSGAEHCHRIHAHAHAAALTVAYGDAAVNAVLLAAGTVTSGLGLVLVLLGYG